MYPDEKKRELVVSIPKSPNSFDLIDITRFVVVFGCSIALFYYDSPLLGYFVLLTSFFCFLLIAVKFFVVAILCQHIVNNAFRLVLHELFNASDFFRCKALRNNGAQPYVFWVVHADH